MILNFRKTLYTNEVYSYNTVITFRGRVQFPTGGNMAVYCEVHDLAKAS